MSINYAPHVVRIDRGVQISIQALASGEFRIKSEYEDDWVFVDVNREQLESFNTYIHAALLEASPY